MLRLRKWGTVRLLMPRRRCARSCPSSGMTGRGSTDTISFPPSGGSRQRRTGKEAALEKGGSGFVSLPEIRDDACGSLAVCRSWPAAFPRSQAEVSCSEARFASGILSEAARGEGTTAVTRRRSRRVCRPVLPGSGCRRGRKGSPERKESGCGSRVPWPGSVRWRRPRDRRQRRPRLRDHG